VLETSCLGTEGDFNSLYFPKFCIISAPREQNISKEGCYYLEKASLKWDGWISSQRMFCPSVWALLPEGLRRSESYAERAECIEVFNLFPPHPSLRVSPQVPRRSSLWKSVKAKPLVSEAIRQCSQQSQVRW
jgi:hypothetical protein